AGGKGDLGELTFGGAWAGVPPEVPPPRGVVKVPRLRITWDAAKYGVDGEGLRLRVLDGDPRVMLDDMAVKADSIEIDPFGLQPGEAEQVARAVSAALGMPAGGKGKAPGPQTGRAGGGGGAGHLLVRGGNPPGGPQ